MFYTKNSTSDDDDEYNESVDDAVDTFYTPDKYKRNTKFKPQNSTYQNQKYYKQNHPSKTSTNWRSNQQTKTSKGKNPQQNG